MNTIEDARQYIKENWKEGVFCPCCNQLVKLYKRKLNSGMVRILIEIYRYEKEFNPEDGWIHVVREMSRNGFDATGMEYSKLKYWGLLESRNESKLPELKSTGYWRVTNLGKKFVMGDVKVPSHVLLSSSKKDRFIRYDDENSLVSVHDALGRKFNYMELMRDIPSV